MDKAPKIYFYCLPQGEGRQPAYQYPLIVIAQGLRALGIKYYANIDYWRLSPDDTTTLFQHHPEVTPSDCDLIITSCVWPSYGHDYPEVIYRSQRHYQTLLIDVCDGMFSAAWEPAARNFDLILKQKNQHRRYPSNCVSSWVFGLSDTLLRYGANAPSIMQRQQSVAHNSRHLHPTRQLAQELFLPKIARRFVVDARFEPLDYRPRAEAIDAADSRQELDCLQSGGRHHPDYMQRLLQTAAVAAFGGIFFYPWERNRELHQLGRYLLRGRSQGRLVDWLKARGWQAKQSDCIYQWDSWRLWESWACGCLTMHVDFDRYGIDMPQLPVAGEHYIGVDFSRPQRAIDQVLSLSTEQLAQIAAAGRAWAMQHYSPKAMAQRLLTLAAL